MLYQLIPNMPKVRLRPVMQKYSDLRLAQPVFARLFGHI